jgi:hypothetical protein
LGFTKRIVGKTSTRNCLPSVEFLALKECSTTHLQTDLLDLDH